MAVPDKITFSRTASRESAELGNLVTAARALYNDIKRLEGLYLRFTGTAPDTSFAELAGLLDMTVAECQDVVDMLQWLSGAVDNANYLDFMNRLG